MATNKLLITPDSQLGLPEFERLYRGEGPTPQEAGQNIFMNFPSQARDVLDRSWQRLGINQSPEDYFSRKLAMVANQASTPQMVGPQRPVVASPASAWPAFQNEIDRNIAIDTGAYDPRYSSPLQKQRAEAMQAIEIAKGAQYRQASVAQAPSLFEANTPEQILRSQLAGDNGTVKKLLFSMQNPGVDYGENLMRDGSEIGAFGLPKLPIDVRPYQDTVGYGGVDNGNIPSRLAKDIFFNPEFQKVLRTNPEDAHFAYERMTGRKLTSDVTEQEALRKSQISSARNYASKALADGATYDPKTQTWKVWNTSDAPDSEGGVTMPGQTTRPYRQLVPASPTQNKWLNEAAPSITNQALPVHNAASDLPASELQSLQTNTQFQAQKTQLEQVLNRSLNGEEMRDLSLRLGIEQIKDPTASLPWWKKVLFNGVTKVHEAGSKIVDLATPAPDGLIAPPMTDVMQDPMFKLGLRF